MHIAWTFNRGCTQLLYSIMLLRFVGVCLVVLASLHYLYTTSTLPSTLVLGVFFAGSRLETVFVIREVHTSTVLFTRVFCFGLSNFVLCIVALSFSFNPLLLALLFLLQSFLKQDGLLPVCVVQVIKVVFIFLAVFDYYIVNIIKRLNIISAVDVLIFRNLILILIILFILDLKITLIIFSKLNKYQFSFFVLTDPHTLLDFDPLFQSSQY